MSAREALMGALWDNYRQAQIRAADLEWGRVPDMDARDAADLIDPLKGAT